MVETITPVVHGGRGRWLGAVVLHALGATATAALFGATLGWVGGRLGAPWGRPGFIVLAFIAILYAVGEHPRLRIPVPQLRRQVPDWWRTFFGRPVAALLYGAGLGIGFATYLSSGALVVVSLAAVAMGRPVVGAVVMAPFGMIRGLSALVSWNAGTSGSGRSLVDRLASSPGRPRRVAGAAALLLVAAVAAAGALRASAGAWWPLDAALLATAFAWASLSKVASMRRWRVQLDAHGLPPWLAGVASWGVPLGEILVPVLVLAGMPRPAGTWALVLLAGFSLELVAVGRRIGPAVPCGCFGRRTAVSPAVAVGRNVGLGVVAFAVVMWGRDAPVAGWPGLPAARDALPALLATTGVVVAALTAWRATAWLSRGARG